MRTADIKFHQLMQRTFGRNQDVEVQNCNDYGVHDEHDFLAIYLSYMANVNITSLQDAYQYSAHHFLKPSLGLKIYRKPCWKQTANFYMHTFANVDRLYHRSDTKPSDMVVIRATAPIHDSKGNWEDFRLLKMSDLRWLKILTNQFSNQNQICKAWSTPKLINLGVITPVSKAEKLEAFKLIGESDDAINNVSMSLSIFLVETKGSKQFSSKQIINQADKMNGLISKLSGSINNLVGEINHHDGLSVPYTLKGIKQQIKIMSKYNGSDNFISSIN